MTKLKITGMMKPCHAILSHPILYFDSQVQVNVHMYRANAIPSAVSNELTLMTFDTDLEGVA